MAFPILPFPAHSISYVLYVKIAGMALVFPDQTLTHGASWHTFLHGVLLLREAQGRTNPCQHPLSPTLIIRSTPPRMMSLHTLEPRIFPPTHGTCCTHTPIPRANICFEILEANLFGLHRWTQMHRGEKSNLVSLVSRGCAGE